MFDTIFGFVAGIVSGLIIYAMIKHGLVCGGVEVKHESKQTDPERLQELIAFAQWVQTLQPTALEKIESNRFVFDDLDDRWQKLAFTLYTSLCEVSAKAKELFEEE